MTGLMHCLDYALYAYFCLCVGYIVLFSAASRRKRKTAYAETSRLHRFLFLIPAYKEDTVIRDSVLSALQQDYPADKFDVLVISDRMAEATDESLRRAGAEVLPIHFAESSKSRALKTAVEHLKDRPAYDFAVILDADNVVDSHYLRDINRMIAATGHRIIQTHRTAKNLNTSIAVLDAAIEEMNNSIFRAGHVSLGLSSALIGSGMVMDYGWFAANIGHTHSAGEDKELEELLLRQHIHTAYAEHIFTWDEKVQKKEVMSNQRRRWIATQFFLASLMWRHLPQALRERNGDYLVKALQSAILPRSILLGALGLAACLSTLISPVASVKWWVLLGLLAIGMYTAIPASMKNRKLLRAAGDIPYFVCSMALNLFRMKGAARKFIHTRHG